MSDTFILSNATVIDGSGKPAFESDLLIQDGRIASIVGPKTIMGPKLVDCTSLVLCPGFIDIHAHSDLEVLRSSAMLPKVGQGITTEIAGNCGVGVFPARGKGGYLNELTRDVLGPYPEVGWEDFDSYQKSWASQGSGTNMGFLQAHSNLRFFAMEGNPNRSATVDEVKKMCRALDKSLEQGCFGLSTGLYYAPCLFADRKELLSLLEVVKSHEKLFTVHMRCEGDDVVDALDEVLDLARLTSVRLQVSHLKAIGRENQRLVDTLLAMLEKARIEGLDVAFDQYPYEYGSTSLYSLLPPPYLRLSRQDIKGVLQSPKEREVIRKMMVEADGWDSIYSLCGWDAIRVITLETNPQYEQMSITEIASRRGQGPFDTFFDLLAEEKGSALMTDVTQTQDSIKKILSHPLMCFGTDALYAGAKAHPRSYNAAIHLLDRYWKRQQVMELESLIAKMTSAPATRLGLKHRGTLAVGSYADLVLFNPVTLKDNATQTDPQAKCDGLEKVWVNGKLVFDGKDGTGLCPGVLLKA